METSKLFLQENLNPIFSVFIHNFFVKLTDHTGIPIWSNTRAGRFIQLKLGTIPDVTNTEGYQLVSDPKTETVVITGVTPSGVFYGVQTLLALMFPDMTVPAGNITDYPR